MTDRQISSYEFGPYRLLPAERLLLREGKPLQLTPKVFDTLLIFVQHHGRLLSKDELMQLIWGDVVVEEGNLTQNIFVLRKRLGESPQDHQYLVTLPLQGYRFVARVRENFAIDSEPVSLPINDLEDSANAAIRSIAVLPFTLLNTPPDHDFAAVGIADTLITKLSGIRQLIVRPTRAVLKFRAGKEDLAAVAKDLQVEALLDGTLQSVGNRMRVNVRLLNAASGLTLWADKFDDEFRDIFSVQDAIAEHVVQALELKLSNEEQSQLAKSYTDNVEAYQLFVKGRYYWDTRTEPGLRKAMGYARQAIERDANYAPAYIGLADSYIFLAEYLFLEPQAAFPPARKAAEKALAIDSTMAEAHASLAEIAFFFEWDWSSAEKHYLRAVKLKPNYASALHWYAWFLMAMGRLDDAAESLKHAQRLDPGCLTINAVTGLPFYYRQEYEQAMAQFRGTLEMEPKFTQARYYLGSALTQLGRYEEAISEFEKVLAEYDTQASALIAYAYAASGERRKALDILRHLQELENYVSPYLLAIVNAGLGDLPGAFKQLEKACHERAAWMVFLRIDPFLNSLRDQPRFADILRCVGLATA